MYYPKSQVKTGLYTNGNEYALITTQKEYVGYYFETSSGKKYTGKNPNNTAIELISATAFPIQQITPNNTSIQNNDFVPETIVTTVNYSTPNLTSEDAIRYSVDSADSGIYSTINNTKSRAIPQFGLTYPTDQEKQKGVFTRYFCKKNNELRYLEITKSTYDRLANKNDNIAWDLYTAASLQWRITGDTNQTYSSNQASAFQVEGQSNFPGFSQYFRSNFLQYYVD
jgi:hypothetical protein